MITRKGNKKVLVSLMLVFVLLFGSFSSFAMGNTNDIPEVKTMKEDLASEAYAKIESDLKIEFEKNEFVGALVYFKDRVDAERTSRLNTLGLTPNQQKVSARKAVINALKDKAEITQENVIRYLKQEESKGNVKEFESFYITNIVYVNATKDVIEKISFMNEVEKIYLDKTIKLVEPEITKNKANISVKKDSQLEWNIERVGADVLWEKGIDGTGITVGIIDTGVDWTHPALKEKWLGYNPKDPSNPINPEKYWYDPVTNSKLPYDEKGVPHGSHCIGTVLGQEPDGSNKIGVAPGAKWIAAKAFTEQGGQESWLLRAGEWMLEAAPDVINNSWGGLNEVNDWYRDIVRSWRAAGIVPVFAAGNETPELKAVPGSISNPANYPESFAVAATDINNVRGKFSLLGPSPYDETLVKPQISAPGVNIRSSVPGGYQDGWNGTSMATPHITGVVALMLQANSSLSVDEIESIIEETATPLTDETYRKSPNFGYGYGLANAYAAVSKVTSGTGFITGKVLASGDDLEEPIISHEQLINEAYLDSNIEIKANLKDDVSIVEAKLLVKTEGSTSWAEVEMEQKSGDHKDGVYCGEIPKDILKEGTLTYKIAVKDFTEKTTESEEYKINIKYGIIPGEYSTDFESYPSGWTFIGEWEWGEPAEGIGPKPHSGTKLVGTVLNGNYSSMKSNALITPPIDLRDASLQSAYISFYQWFKTPIVKDSDVCRVLVSTNDGDNWTQVGKEYKGDGSQWLATGVNLKDYIGSETPVYVAFNFETDIMDNAEGWYIDDLSINGAENIPPVAPTGLTGEATIEGSNLNWEASTDADVDGYNIYRSETSGSGYTKIGYTLGLNYIDRTVEANKTYYYVIKAIDFSGNESGYSNEVEVLSLNIDKLYYSDFENDNGSLTSGGINNSWEWGEVNWGETCGWDTPLPSTPPIGKKVWATNLNDEYAKNSDSWLQIPEVTIPSEGNPYLSIWHWIYTEEYSDICEIQISTDGDTWTTLPGGSFDGELKWTNTQLSLEAYKGKKVSIRFHFTSDGAFQWAGWYINSVFVYNLKDSNVNSIVKNTPVEYIRRDAPRNFEFKINGNNGLKNLANSNEITESKATISSLPGDAVVTVLETGRSVKTDPATGKFTIIHGVNENENDMWTLRAEAYGHYPKDVKVHVGKDETVYKEIQLDPIPMGTITGRIIDRYSGEPIANANLRVKEDYHIASVNTDEFGNFTIPNVYEGSYTIRVIHDDYMSNEVSINVVANRDNNIDIELERFVGYPGEIAYDDGTNENALLLGVGGGTGVNFTPNGYGKLKGARVFFWGEDWPTPGGNETSIAIIETDENGEVLGLVGQPKDITVERGAWNYIDLSEYNFGTDKNFVIAVIQTKDVTSSPAIAIDANADAKAIERSVVYNNGSLSPITQLGVNGAFMIRANIEYSIDSIEISNLEDVNYTNQDRIVVEGNAPYDCSVKVFVNSNEPITVDTQNKEFSTVVELTKEINTISVSAVLNGRETEPTNSITVIKDSTLPELTIANPIDEQSINTRYINVTGNVRDKYFDKLIINGEEVELNRTGGFEKPLILNEGENNITISAYDLAGNETVVERKVYVNIENPVIKDIQPSSDLTVKAGDTIEISFTSEETNGEANFKVVLPFELSSNNVGIPMEEVEPGYYKAEWTVPEGMLLNNANIEIEFTDSFGNVSYVVAPGRLTIEGSEEAVLPMSDLPYNTVIVGNEAYNIKYLNNNAEAQSKLIEWFNGKNPVYIKLDNTTIVNIKGEPVTMDIFPDEITYYDADGNIAVFRK